MQLPYQQTRFIFFSRLESFNFCLAARQLLDTADESMFCYLSSVRSCLNFIESPEHKISLELCIALNALLGAVFLSSRDGRTAKGSYEQVVQILSKKIAGA